MKNLLYQIFYIIIFSVVVSVLYNQFSDKPLPFIKEPMKILTEMENIDDTILEPSIKVIDINLAKVLFENKVLFVDARSEEYYLEGHIPNAICNDNFDSLVFNIENMLGMQDAFVVYCSDDDCGSSEDLSYELQSYGFNNILLFKGGWQEWQDAKMPQQMR